MSAFASRKGEVVGLAGLAGSGPEAMLAAIAGLSDISQGRITLPSGADRPTHFRQAIAAGVAFVSGDRRKLGLMLDKPIWENIVQVRSVGLARDGVVSVDGPATAAGSRACPQRRRKDANG